MLNSSRRERWIVPLALLGFTIFFYWKVIFTNRVMFPWDIAGFFYPTLNFIHEELRHFRLPFWNAYVMSGFPIIGDPEAQIFYPPNWLMLLVQPFESLSYKTVEIQLIFHFLLAGVFMYYLARSYVHSATAALISAVLFEFCGAMVAHTQHLASIETMAWYPLIFLLARRGLLENRFPLTVAAGALFGIQVLAGHAQHSVYLGLLLLLYFAYEACCGPLRKQLWPCWIYSLAVIAGIGAALSMVQLIPSMELGSLSVRKYITYFDVVQGNEPRYLITLFLPNYFGGLNGVPKWYPYDISFNYVFLTVPGCLLACLGLVETVRRRNFFWLVLVVLCIELSFGTNGRLGPLIYHVPLLNLFRNIPTFFDLANFALCLMAGIGAEALFSMKLSPRWKQHLPAGLASLLFATTICGLVFGWWKFHGWFAMLAVLALSSIVVAGLLRNRFSVPFSKFALLGLIVAQLVHYNMNQFFNASIDNPRHFTNRNEMLGRKDLLQRLREDRAADFRVAAIAEHMLSANGWNVWRVPGIHGWNPVLLRRYDSYLRGLFQTGEYATPYGGPDHNLNSPMLDLLGAKYLIMGDTDIEKQLSLPHSAKFTRRFKDVERWNTYENRDYLSRSWFYSRAYVVPDEETALALMSSSWFDARKTLLFENNQVPASYGALIEPLPTIEINPKDASSISTGTVMADPYCAKPLPMVGGWGEGENDRLQFSIASLEQQGRYLLSVEYTASSNPAPVLEVQIHSGDRTQQSEPRTLPRTAEWGCRKARHTELGTFNLAPGENRLFINASIRAQIHLYSLRLVRLPEAQSDTGTFSFANFQSSAHRISFDSTQDRDGFVLLNEIFYPGWEAQVDGQSTPILQADGIFRVLAARAGSHHIEMTFKPRYFALGAAVSVITLISLLAYFAVGAKAANSRNAEQSGSQQGMQSAIGK
ncbi:MAG: YfhO family protein [Acidobacteria bacterium]|nr:YfhO family protein [Acidobacteriota bacterium]